MHRHHLAFECPVRLGWNFDAHEEPPSRLGRPTFLSEVPVTGVMGELNPNRGELVEVPRVKNEAWVGALGDGTGAGMLGDLAIFKFLFIVWVRGVIAVLCR